MTPTPYHQSCLRWSRQTNKEATVMAGSLIERLRPSSIEATPVESAPSAEEAPVISLLLLLPTIAVESPIERLQRLLRRWRSPIISLRDLYTHGPHCDRNKQTALDLAQILVRQGVLTPIAAGRRNGMK